MEKYFTVEQIANATSLSLRAIRDYIKTGKLKATKVGRKWLIREIDFDNFMFELRAKSMGMTPDQLSKIISYDKQEESQEEIDKQAYYSNIVKEIMEKDARGELI